MLGKHDFKKQYPLSQLPFFIESKNMVPHSELPDAREEILEYLKAHPFAADTVDGIIQWWLPLQRYETAREVIQKALEDLIEQGVIDYVDMGNGRRIFRLAKPK